MKTERPTDKIRRHHAAIHQKIRDLVARVEAIGARPSASDREFLHEGARFLRTDILGHARGEERHLYPALERLLAEHVSSTAFMSLEHVMIESELQYLVEELERARAAETLTPERLADLRRCAHRFSAILEMHTANEEEIMFRVADERLKPEHLDEIVRRMHEKEQP